MPDGSMPLYANHPLPGMPDADPALPDLGWGPELGSGQDCYFRQIGRRRRPRTGLAIGPLVICAVAVGMDDRRPRVLRERFDHVGLP
jgi:hypothetical protein